MILTLGALEAHVYRTTRFNREISRTAENVDHLRLSRIAAAVDFWVGGDCGPAARRARRLDAHRRKDAASESTDEHVQERVLGFDFGDATRALCHGRHWLGRNEAPQPARCPVLAYDFGACTQPRLNCCVITGGQGDQRGNNGDLQQAGHGCLLTGGRMVIGEEGNDATGPEHEARTSAPLELDHAPSAPVNSRYAPLICSGCPTTTSTSPASSWKSALGVARSLSPRRTASTSAPVFERRPVSASV